MARYDYTCEDCSAVFEVEHPMSEKPQISCPACESTHTHKVFDASGIIFTGSGFYNTDYKNSSSASGNVDACGNCSASEGGA